MSECRYPVLAEPYNQSLREAVTYILERFDVLGIIAAGSIIRGTHHATSDFDMYVIHRHPQRQLIHRSFNTVATQIFVNPPHRIRRYFADELAEANCTAAHMLVTGFVVLDRDPVVEQLRAEAQTILAGPAQVTPGSLQMTRYHAVDAYENALDMAAIDPITASLIAQRAVYTMLHYVFLARQEFIPPDKDLLARLDPPLAALARQFFATNDLDMAGQIADLTIQTRRFFPLESGLEDV